VSIGHLVRFYSTPFVVLTDAFTDKVLCGGDVGRGHFKGNLRRLFDWVAIDTPTNCWGRDAFKRQISCALGLTPVGS
jgi:hypothetical protein